MQGIVFDLDGVLVDSEGLHEAAWLDALAPYGVRFTHEEYVRRWLGGEDLVLVREAGAARGVPLPETLHPELLAAKAAAMRRLAERGVPTLPGALELLRAAARELPVALCTGSRRHEVELLLGSLDVLGLFRAVVTADDVAATKPHPEGYVRAARALGAEPGRVLAIEDSPTGLAAARGAGLVVLAVDASLAEGGAPRPAAGRLAGAHGVVRDLLGLEPRSLARWFDGVVSAS